MATFDMEQDNVGNMDVANEEIVRESNNNDNIRGNEGINLSSSINTGLVKKTPVENKGSEKSEIFARAQPQAEDTRYGLNSVGAYIVHINSNGQNIGNMHPLALGKLLYTSNIKNIKEVKRLGINNIAVEFNSAAAANSFLDSDFITNQNLTAYIPNYQLTSKGIVKGIPVEVSMDEVIAHSQNPLNLRITEAKRFTRKIADNVEARAKTQTVLITFKGQTIPSHIYMWHCRFKVESFNPRPMQCWRCQRFGHRANNCKGKAICRNCGEEHDTKECNATQYKCANCEGPHRAGHVTCMKYAEQCKITTIMRKKNMSFREASRMVGNNGEKTYASSVAGRNSEQNATIKIRQENITKEGERLQATWGTGPRTRNITERTVGTKNKPAWDKNEYRNIIQTYSQTSSNKEPEAKRRTAWHEEVEDKMKTMKIIVEALRNHNQEGRREIIRDILEFFASLNQGGMEERNHGDQDSPMERT